MSGSIHLLHHKSWHVWNKNNLARIEKDEREAAEREAQLKSRALDAERESRYERLSTLKRKREGTEEEKPENPADETPTTNINFFSEIERQEEEEKSKPGYKRRKIATPHPEAESERKLAEEREEQKWTTYLGKDSIEKMKVKPWWYSDGPAPQLSERRAVFEKKSKVLNDPLEAMHRYIEETSHPVSVQVLEDPQLRERVKKKESNVWRRGPEPREREKIMDGMELIKELQAKEEEEQKKHKKDKQDKKDKRDKKKEKRKEKHDKRKEKEKRKKRPTRERDDEEQREAEKLKLEELRKQRVAREMEEERKERQLLGIPTRGESQYPGGSTRPRGRGRWLSNVMRGSM